MFIKDKLIIHLIAIKIPICAIFLPRFDTLQVGKKQFRRNRQ